MYFYSFTSLTLPSGDINFEKNGTVLGRESDSGMVCCIMRNIVPISKVLNSSIRQEEIC